MTTNTTRRLAGVLAGAALLSGVAPAATFDPAAIETPTCPAHIWISAPTDGFPLELGKQKAGEKASLRSHKVNANKETVLHQRFIANKDWQELSFEFKAVKDGVVSVELMGGLFNRDGAPKGGVQHFAFVDDVSLTVDGEEVDINGGFEDMARGAAAQWKTDAKAALLVDEQEARRGRVCGAVSAGHRLKHSLKVEAGKTYAISAWFRAKPQGLVPPKK